MGRKGTLFYPGTTNIQVDTGYWLKRTPFLRLDFGTNSSVGEFPQELALMYKLVKKVNSLSLPTTSKLAFLGMGPAVGANMLAMGHWAKLDVFESDTQIVRFVNTVVMAGLQVPFTIVQGDWHNTISDSYDLIITDLVYNPEDLTQAELTLFSNHLNANGKVLTRPNWNVLPL